MRRPFSFHKRTQPKIPIESHYVGPGDDQSSDSDVDTGPQKKLKEMRAKSEKEFNRFENRMGKMLFSLDKSDAKFKDEYSHMMKGMPHAL